MCEKERDRGRAREGEREGECVLVTNDTAKRKSTCGDNASLSSHRFPSQMGFSLADPKLMSDLANLLLLLCA